MANIKDTLKDSTNDILSEDALNEIESVFDTAVDQRAQLQLEVALARQDEDHAGKVQQLLEAIDDDHSKKLERIVQAINESHAQKLAQVISKYQRSLNEEAGEFKSSVVNGVSTYLDVYLEKAFPQNTLDEAVKNKRAESILGEVRKLLAVDMALAKDEIKDAVLDGKHQINEAHQKLDTVSDENTKLKSEVEHLRSAHVLSTLAAHLPEHKKKYVKRVLCDKTAEFITENFEYTVKLFDKEMEKKTETLTEEANATVRGKVDAITEQVIVKSEPAMAMDGFDEDPALNAYMGELGKY